jgi:hypothetical protein
MRRRPAAGLVSLSLALMLSLAMTPSVVSAATNVGTANVATQVSATARPSTDHQRATQALERAEALMAGELAPAAQSGQGQARVKAARADAGPNATLVMRDLFSALGDLDPAQRKVAKGILARPTDGVRRRGRSMRRGGAQGVVRRR